jgi:hypothetical protein
MPQSRGRASFAQETFPCFRVGRDTTIDDFESHFISQDRVEGLEGDAHRASTQFYMRAVDMDSDLVMVKASRRLFRERPGPILTTRLTRFSSCRLSLAQHAHGAGFAVSYS